MSSIPVSELVELDRNVSRRKETDRIMSFPKWFVLSIITLGIAGIIADYRLITRRNEHFKRQKRCEESMLKLLESKSNRVDIATELAKMSSIRKDYDEEEGEKSAILWTILSVVTGIAGLYVIYFLTRDVYRHHLRQNEYVGEFVNSINKLGIETSILSSAIKAQYQVPKRGFFKYLLLSIVTLGIFGVYWYYVVYEDWNNHFKTQWVVEDEILAVVQRMP